MSASMQKTFTEIRSQFPKEYLLLFDYEAAALPDGKFELLSAADVQAFCSGEEMFEAYKQQKNSGRKIMFCSPEIRERFIFERRPSMRIWGQ